MKRKKVPSGIETLIMIRSGRRCAICFGQNRDFEVKEGQVAHLDRSPNNNRFDNLAFLCLEHHNKYDSITSQSKNYTKSEVKFYRKQLYEHIKSLSLTEKSKNEKQILHNYLYGYHDLFEFLFTTGGESAYLFQDRAYILLENLVTTWFCSGFRCNDKELQEYQDLIYENGLNIFNNILNKYEYNQTAAGSIFKWQEDQNYNAKFDDIKKEMEQYIINIKIAWDKLKTFLA